MAATLRITAVLAGALATAGCGGTSSPHADRTSAPILRLTLAPRDRILLGEKVAIHAWTDQHHAVTIEADPFPFGKFERLALANPRADGSLVVHDTPDLNTRYRAVANDGTSNQKTVYVSPRGQLRATVVGSNTVRVKMSLKLARSARTHSTIAYIYMRQPGEPRYRLIGTARYVQSGSTAAAQLIARVSPKAKDRYFSCTRKRYAEGMGSAQDVVSGCGGQSLAYPLRLPHFG